MFGKPSCTVKKVPLNYNSLRAPLVARNYHPAHLHLIRHPFNTTQSENKQSILLKEVPYTESVGSFSMDDGNGSQNVSFKINSRFFNL